MNNKKRMIYESIMKNVQKRLNEAFANTADDVESEIRSIIPILKKIYNHELYIDKDVNSSGPNLIMMYAVGMVGDGLLPSDYRKPGLRAYKGEFNPYNYSWFDEGYDDEFDEYEDGRGWVINWISDNFENFKKIYNFCASFKKILTESTIWELWTVIYDDDDTIIEYFKTVLSD